jgi:hypothetical protein
MVSSRQWGEAIIEELPTGEIALTQYLQQYLRQRKFDGEAARLNG